MTLVDVETTQDPLVLDNFSFISNKEYPYTLIGHQLKSFYDQKRIKLKAKYDPVDKIHLLPTAKINPRFFRGFKIDAKPEYRQLIEKLRTFNTHLTDVLDVEAYKKCLAEYNLTCDDCYALLRKGIYPIDGRHISKFSNCSFTLEQLYNDVFDTKSVPAFQSFCSFNIFILCNESLFPSTFNK